MARGREWTGKERENITEALSEYFKLGYSVNKACVLAEFPSSTFQDWMEEDESLRIKVAAWQNETNAQARKNWVGKVNDGDYRASKSWLEANEKETFSTRQEITGKDGEPVSGVTITVSDGKTATDESDD